jgi:hypothetical protein
MEVQNFAREYESKTDEELLRLALNSSDLTPEANTLLLGELSKRRLYSREQLEAFRQQEIRAKGESEKDPGRLWIVHSYGIGRRYLAKQSTNMIKILELSSSTRQFSSCCSESR